MTALNAGSTRSTVVVVNDDTAERERCLAWLRDLGFESKGVATPQAGLDAVREEKPAVIVLDLAVPGMDGWELLRELHADPGLADTPVVVVSSVEGPSGDLVVDGYVLAPFVPSGADDLLQTILGHTVVERVA